MEALRLFRRFQRHGKFRRAGRAEIIGDAADRDDERVIGNAARGRRSRGPPRQGRAELGPTCRAVEPDHFAEMIAEMMPVALGQIIQLVLGRVHAAGRDQMQQRLP